VKLTPTKIAGALVLELEPIIDERGFFARTYCHETLRAAGAGFGSIRQTSISQSKERGTLRGLHWQSEPKSEAKIVRVTAGSIYDVVVDLRRASPTYCDWFGLELDALRHAALLIPAGCAHGFLTLEPDCTVEYTMDADFAPECARGARWDDPAFGIVWPFAPLAISERDRAWPNFAR
jgi:dTDP-4-dehydrorhamnose 3,5-epimerase